MRAHRCGVLLSLGALLSACDQDYPNPFESPNVTATPPPGAALLLTSNVHDTRAGTPREVYSVNEDGSGLTRLTFCNSGTRACDTAEAAVGRDTSRIAVRRTTEDANGDGALTPADGVAVVFVDLDRGLEGTLLAADRQVTGLDWSPTDDLLVYSANSDGGVDDLFRMDPNGSNNSPLTVTPALDERRPRIDATGSVAVYERIDATGLGSIWIFVNNLSSTRVTDGGEPGEPLPGTPYRVGSDADPDFSPDGRFVVFRRLTGPGSGGVGSWDVLVAPTDGTQPAAIASGAAYRGAPDWGPRGIVFEEIDPAGSVSLVLLAPDGTNRRTLASAAAGLSLSYPRWLP